MSDIETLDIAYTFTFEDGNQKFFHVCLNKRTLDLIDEPRAAYPEWTKLEFNQCPNCPLDKKLHKHCPVALSLIDMMHAFKDSVSHEPVTVDIVTQVREYKAVTVLQRGLSSLLGLYMVTSGCPIMEKLKPMARLHLPFATMEETAYRVISMYLMAQYFTYRRGGNPDWDMKNLVKAYDDIRVLNNAFSKRLKAETTKDAGVNAVVILNNFADYVPFSVDEDMLDEIELLFGGYNDK